MRNAGFIFSLDAFVAFTLSMITISMLVFAIGTPKPYYPSLEQAHQLAHDTLTALAASSDSVGQLTYLEQIMANDQSAARRIMVKVAGGDPNYRGIIPKGYGYRLETYNFNDDSWRLIYDAGTDRGYDRFGKNFTKLQASATTFGSIYTSSPEPGASPYCYLSCFGYSPAGNADPCDITPCNISISNFLPGENSVQIIRLVVYT